MPVTCTCGKEAAGTDNLCKECHDKKAREFHDAQPKSNVPVPVLTKI